MSVGRVYIVRHGNTFDKGDVILRVGGTTDLPLSSSGVAQAMRLSTALESVEFNKAYSSDLKRTRQTADAILGAQRYDLAEFLTEVDYGPDEGRPETEVVARLGANALKKWDTNAIPPDGWKVDVKGLRTAWQAFLASCDANSNTLVVTSNGVARFLLDVVKFDKCVPLKLRTGAYGVIELGAAGPVLEGWDIRP
jgi:probable phosphoglycerate mutase